MEILDNNGNILGLYISSEKYKPGKNFLTSHNSEFQAGTFNLVKGEKILNHVHLQQKRRIVKTSEAITVLAGKIKVNFYSEEKEYITSVLVTSGETIILINGGHGIDIIEDSKFIEIKQGPFFEKLDKSLFHD